MKIVKKLAEKSNVTNINTISRGETIPLQDESSIVIRDVNFLGRLST